MITFALVLTGTVTHSACFDYHSLILLARTWLHMFRVMGVHLLRWSVLVLLLEAKLSGWGQQCAES